MLKAKSVKHSDVTVDTFGFYSFGPSALVFKPSCVIQTKT
jgi:hypothetical protein